MQDIVAFLRESADKLEAAFQQALLPAAAMTLAEAEAKLRLANPDALLAFEPKITSWPDRRTIEWLIYDGKHNFRGLTLAEAVNQALAQHQPKPPAPADPVADLQANLESVTDPNIPF
jgi:hypothetical protein